MSQSSLTIVAHGATLLKDVELIGKQDPYLRFTLNITDTKSFQKTFVHKNAGKNPVWNQTFEVPLSSEPLLYVELMDEETTADAVIAFTAIPISQVVQAPGGTFNGLFEVYLPDGKPNGDVHLTLTARNVPGINVAGGIASQGPVRGTSQIIEAHQKRMKAIKNKEIGADAGMAVAGGLFALGAGLLANKVVADEKKKDEARKEQELEEARARERLEEEKKQLEEQKKQLEEQKVNLEKQQQEARSSEHHGEHHHKEHHHGGHREWDANGTYSSGEKVSYHGRVWICLQGHTSNPTWQPDQAHSLWRAD
ncbi:hypothetical protein BGX21_007969 [Mortierella sp. AD011]|nr:hypothetical protein BGX20_007359 [Mortierella sp. AD010]KAF9398306.1 hypothetical protein BGX21_007969 [Mortierella sp. AD011]